MYKEASEKAKQAGDMSKARRQDRLKNVRVLFFTTGLRPQNGNTSFLCTSDTSQVFFAFLMVSGLLDKANFTK